MDILSRRMHRRFVNAIYTTRVANISQHSSIRVKSQDNKRFQKIPANGDMFPSYLVSSNQKFGAKSFPNLSYWKCHLWYCHIIQRAPLLPLLPPLLLPSLPPQHFFNSGASAKLTLSFKQIASLEFSNEKMKFPRQLSCIFFLYFNHSWSGKKPFSNVKQYNTVVQWQEVKNNVSCGEITQLPN